MQAPCPRDFVRSEGGHTTVAVLFWFPIAALLLVTATGFATSVGRHGQMWQSAQEVTQAASVARGGGPAAGLRTAGLMPVARN